MMFECKLVKNGIVEEYFYREGDSAESVLEGLEIFQWDDGEWQIAVVVN